MGIVPSWFPIFHEAYARGGLKRGDAVLDIGASQLYCRDDPDALNRFLVAFDAPPYGRDELARMANEAFAADLFRRAGFRYAAIDYAAFPGVIRRDLNSQGLPWRHRGRYRFVANTGTSEHILNQYNVFKVMHDACAVGGIMYHGVPGWGEYEHGIVNYSPKLFWALAHDNRYEILRFWGWSDGQVAPLRSDFLREIYFATAPRSERIWLHLLLRKTSRRAFRGINDPTFLPAAVSPREIGGLAPSWEKEIVRT